MGREPGHITCGARLFAVWLCGVRLWPLGSAGRRDGLCPRGDPSTNVACLLSLLFSVPGLLLFLEVLHTLCLIPISVSSQDAQGAQEVEGPQPPAFALDLESVGEGVLSDAVHLLLSLLRQVSYLYGGQPDDALK